MVRMYVLHKLPIDSFPSQIAPHDCSSLVIHVEDAVKKSDSLVSLGRKSLHHYSFDRLIPHWYAYVVFPFWINGETGGQE